MLFKNAIDNEMNKSNEWIISNLRIAHVVAFIEADAADARRRLEVIEGGDVTSVGHFFPISSPVVTIQSLIPLFSV